MAISFISQPSTTAIHSAYRPLRFVVSSNSSSISKVQCEVYIDGTLVKTITHDPDINTTNQFTFDVSGFVRDNLTYLVPSINSLLHLSATESGVSKPVYCIFNEVNLTGGLLVVSATDYTSNTSIAFQATLQHEDTQSFATYYTDNTSKPFLTNMPDGERISRGESIRLGFVFSGTASNTRLEQYQGATLLGTSNGTAGAYDTTYKRGYVMINTTYLSGLCDRFIIYLVDGSNNRVSEQRTFNVTGAACEDDKRLWFMNQFGDFDAFSFTGELTEGLEASSEDFKKVLSHNFSVNDRGREEISITAYEKFSVASRPINREEYRWLRELKHSPQVFLQSGSNFVPIIITNKEDYSIKSFSIGEPMVVEYIKANDLIIQRN